MQWQDFDLEGKVKIPFGFYLILAYLMRGYLIWIVSLTYSDDRALLLSLIYPNGQTFTANLLLGVPAVFCFALFAMKSKRDTNWFLIMWQKQPVILLLALLLDLSLQVWSLAQHILSAHWAQIGLLLAGIYLFWYWHQSQRVRRFFRNWLEH